MPGYESYIKARKISRINDLEIDRYVNFFMESYKDDLANCEYVVERHPRWSIISGYYAMHDITKLFFAKSYRLKVNKPETHETTINILAILLKQKEVIALFQAGYEYKQMAYDLFDAREERSKAQYYTGSDYARDYYAKKSNEFLETVVKPYTEKMLTLIGD